MDASVDQIFLRRLRLLAFVEAISTLLLFFVAMPLKYLADLPMAVTVVGGVHGLLFTALALAFVVAVSKVPISRGLALGGIVGAIVPFGPFVVDRWLVKVGRGADAGTALGTRAS